MRNQIFISYSHRDREWLEKLETVLKPYVRNSNLLVWNDSKINAGEKWRDEIKKALAAAKVAVLLVTPNFLASDFIAENELPPLLDAAGKEGLTVLWVAVSASGYKETEIANYQAANNPARPLTRLTPAELDEVLVVICEQIKEVAVKSATSAAEKTLTSTASVKSVQLLGSAAKRVVLIYKHNSQLDEYVLKLLERGLTTYGCDVFVDRYMAVGVEWAKEIERRVRTADVVIPILSSSAVASEMFIYEIQIAHDAAQRQQGKPWLLPVRVSYQDPLPDPIASVLNPIQQAMWNDPRDDQSLTAEIIRGLETEPTMAALLPRSKLEPVGGATPLDSPFYILRSTDRKFSDAIVRQDSIVLVKGARQMGKTSLLARGLQQARAAGARVVLTDFQKLNAEDFTSAETLFMTLGEWIAEELNLPTLPDQDWQRRRGASRNFELYLKRHVLGQIAEPLVWGLDEVDRLFTCAFASEVFGLFRSWHNERATNPDGPLQRLTLAIAYATEAHLFITDINQSPFNVGTRLTLSDFTFEQVAELNRRYGAPLRAAAEVERFTQSVGGQPYLVRRGLHEIVNGNLSLNEFLHQADRDEGPFGDHLRRMLVLLAQDAELCEIVRAILRGQPCPHDASFYRLRSAGVMTGDGRHEARPRCELYARYLMRHLL